MDKKLKKYLTVAVLGLASGSIYFLPYIKYVFYDAQIATMGINNTQSSLLLTMYTIGNIILYIPGGMIADRVSPKKSMIISLVITALLSYFYAFSLNFYVSIFIWLGLSLSTAFIFWSSLMKAVRMVGDENEQGFIYGIYYSCNGITGVITQSAALYAYRCGTDMKSNFIMAILAGGSVALIAAILILFIMDGRSDGEEKAKSEDEKFNFKDAKSLILNPYIWGIAITILCGYGFYSSIAYFNPYLTSVHNVSNDVSGIFTIIRNYLLLLLAPIGGLLADRIFKSTCKWVSTGFLILASLFVAVIFIPKGVNPFFVGVYTLLPGAVTMMVYGVIFSTISEVNIPRKLTATTIGIASMIAYMPDTIYTMIFGRWLDKYGATGYNYVFIFLACSAVLGSILSIITYKNRNKISSMLSRE